MVHVLYFWFLGKSPSIQQSDFLCVSFWDILSPNQLKLTLMIQVMIIAVIKVMMYVVIIVKELE